MNYNLIYFLNGKLAYVVLGVLAATLAGSFGYFIWLFLGKEAARFYIKNTMRFLKLILTCFLLPIIPFFILQFLKGMENGEEILPVITPITVLLFILSSVWLVMLAMVLLYRYMHYRSKLRLCEENISVGSNELDVVLDKWKKRLGIKKKISVYYNDVVSSPAIIYNKGYQILLPTYTLSDEEINIALLHEPVHFKHGDIRTKNIGFLVNAVHAFNPVSYALRTQIERWAEVDCDLDACEIGKEEFSRKEYFDCILNMKQKSQEALYVDEMCCFMENQKLIEFRVDMMVKYRKDEWKYSLWAFVLTLFLMFSVTAGIYGISSGAFRLWYAHSLHYTEETLEENQQKLAENSIFADTELVYSDEQVLNQTQSTDFTINPNEAWIFDVSEEALSTVFVSVVSDGDNYCIGCIDSDGEVFCVEASGDKDTFLSLENSSIRYVYIKNQCDSSNKVEMLVMKKATAE